MLYNLLGNRIFTLDLLVLTLGKLIHIIDCFEDFQDFCTTFERPGICLENFPLILIILEGCEFTSSTLSRLGKLQLLESESPSKLFMGVISMDPNSFSLGFAPVTGPWYVSLGGPFTGLGLTIFWSVMPELKPSSSLIDSVTRSF